jgi:hypothetical protein
MEWNATTDALRDGALCMALIAATLPVFAWAAEPGKRFLAASPGVCVLVVFVASCVASAFGIWNEPAGMVQAVLFLGALALIVPSFHALREHWFVLVHGLTLFATFWLWFIAAVWLGRDGT